MKLLIEEKITLFSLLFVGKTAFASVNLIMPFIMILGAIGFMLGTGGNAIVSKTLGEGEPKLAQKYFSMIIYCTMIGGIIVSILGFIFMPTIAKSLGARGEMLAGSILYGRISMISLTCFMLQNVFQSLLVTAGKPKLGLLITVSAGLTNMTLDAVFVYGLKLGIAGAALATVISQLVSAVACHLYAVKRYPVLRPEKRYLKVECREAFAHLRIGVPMALQFSVTAGVSE